MILIIKPSHLVHLAREICQKCKSGADDILIDIFAQQGVDNRGNNVRRGSEVTPNDEHSVAHARVCEIPLRSESDFG